jgi:HEAT repeat protein
MAPDASEFLDRADRQPSRVDPESVIRAVDGSDLSPEDGAEVLATLAENAERNPLGDLEPLLTGRDHGLRTTAITAVIRVGSQDPELVEPLVPVLVSELEDDTFQTSTHLLRALRVVAPAYPSAFHSSVETLLGSLSSTGRDGREAVVSVLYWVSEDEPERLVEHASTLQTRLTGLDRAEAESDRAIEQSDPVDPAVREMKEDQLFNDRVRVLLLQTLTNAARASDDPAGVVDIEAVAPLARQDQYPEIRRECLRLLGTVARSEPEALREELPAIAEYTTADDERVAGTAAWTLAALADAYPDDVSAVMETRVDSVVDLLHSDGAQPRGHALGLLAYLAETDPGSSRVEAACPRLVELLSDDHGFVRIGAVLTLQSLGAATALDELEQVSKTDPDPEVRQAATAAVRAIDSER